jgi:2-methylisocitrate lyase-like PEP mutase family enzyme
MIASLNAQLRQRLAGTDLLVLPGASNALTARIIEDAGFEAIYITGAGVANTFLGVPDIGLLSLTHLAHHVSACRDAVQVPLLVDADTGFGNAVNVAHTVKTLERAGANAIQLEDQTFPKRCGHFTGKDVISSAEMIQKVRSAVDARTDDDFVVIARTDARAVLGLSEACDRANAYREAGADVVFVEAPRSEEEVERVSREVQGPQIINMVHGGATPLLPLARLQELKYAVALYANLTLLAGVKATQATLDLLRDDAPQEQIAASIATWDERQRLVRLPEFSALEETYSHEQD